MVGCLAFVVGHAAKKAKDYGIHTAFASRRTMNRISEMRLKHHALAMLVAHGLDPVQIEKFAHIGQRRIELLLDNPVFRELVAHYRGGAQFKDIKCAFKDKSARSGSPAHP
jgi:hypothetical protein